MSTESEGLQVAPDAGGEAGWKCGNEFAPFHPSASHVEPAYRDGWNACYRAAAKAGLRLPSTTPAPQAGSLEPTAWRYVPSDVWGGPVLTQDPKTVALARQFGRDVEALFTQSQLDTAVAAALATPPAVAVGPPPDYLGLALDLESCAKKTESQTAERAMRAAALALRGMLKAPLTPRGTELLDALVWLYSVARVEDKDYLAATNAAAVIQRCE